MFRKFRKDILGSIRNKKINIFFLFLSLSFVILVFTKLSKNYTNTITFGVNKVNVPDKFVILNDSTAQLRITLKANGFKWAVYYFKKPKIDIDFVKDIKQVNKKFVLEKGSILANTEVQLGSDVEILNISPDILFFSYDVNLVKKVPIKLNLDIHFEPGFDIEHIIKMKPDSIVVVGPHAMVSKIKSIETEKLRLNNVKSNVSNDVKLKFPKSEDLKFSSKETHISAIVKKFTEGTLKIPITVVNVPKDMKLNYFPKFINVTYYTSLDNFSLVKMEDFIIACDYNTLEDQQSYLTPNLIKAPKTVKNVKMNRQHVEFIILE